MIKLILPSAKIVPEELQNIGKLPSVIYPINGDIVFNFLYKQYSEKCNIEILCYENADKIYKKLDKFKDVKITTIPTLTDLAHTIYYGLNQDGPFIINFGDTIVMDNIYEQKSDTFYYTEDYVYDKWTYFDIKDGQLTNIYDKINLEKSEFKKEKLFVGVFYLSDSKCFKECLDKVFNEKDDSMSAFYKALVIYSKIHPLTAIKTKNWFDIGHADKYTDTNLEVRAREFNHISIDKNRGVLTKYSDNKDKFIGEIKWYLKLPADIEYISPRIFNYSLDYNEPYVSMEYYAYHTIHELFLNSDLDIYQWKTIFERIRFIFCDMNRYEVNDINIIPSLESMYLKKTIDRLEEIKKDVRFQKYFNYPTIINGVKYKSIDSIMKILRDIIPKLLYDVKKFNIIHGDLCFSNMLIDDNLSFIKVIDPRGKFGNFDIYGDSRYEIAKLLHSVDGKYDYIIKDLFNLKYSDNTIEFSIQNKDRKFDLYEVFLNVFKNEIGNSLKKIELIESLLFLSMIPLHNENFNHQLVLLGTGLEILDRIADIKER